MTDRPILFSGPMVRAILEGRKTQTRRLLKPQPPEDVSFRGIYAPGLSAVFGDPENPSEDDLSIRLPSLKDQLWVREQWKTDRAYDDLSPSEMGGEEPLIFLSDNAVERWGWEPDPVSIWGRHRQGMHMPRWASRITLDVTDVRVQRLQEISEADAIAEGIEKLRSRRGFYDPTKSKGVVRMGEYFDWATDAFGVLWDSLNAERAPWSDNPWVVAITFKSHLCNIDQMEPAQ